MSFQGKRHDYCLECRDAVHGFVYLSEAEWAIVDCPTFQRLRDIRQLAMAHLVYPGATHTRFEHSLGCVHLSDRIYEAVKRQVDRKQCPNFAKAYGADDEQVGRGLQVVRLAALLHDLGHGPFSHTGENLMPKVNGRPITHEEMTARLIRHTEIKATLEREFDKDVVEEVIAVATAPHKAKLPEGANLAWLRFLNDILTGELGSDRMDYLLRDAIHSGQSAGLFDHRKLIDSMIIVRPPPETGEDHRLGLDPAGWLVAEQMVAARYLMYVALYFHKTKRIYEIHLEKFLAAWLRKKFREPFLPCANLKEYISLTDSRVWSAIYEEARKTRGDLKGLAQPFVDRSHFRLAREVLLADNCAPAASDETLKRFLAEHEAARKQEAGSVETIKAALAAVRRNPRVWDANRLDKLRDALHDVRSQFGTIEIDEPKHHAVSFFGSGDKIWVSLNGETRYLDDLSEIVAGMPDKIWRGRIYADQSKREDVKAFCDNWLRKNPCEGGRHEPAKGSG